MSLGENKMGLFGKIMTLAVFDSAKKLTEKISKRKDRKESNDYIKVSGFIDDLIGLNYKEVKESLESYGFTNVSYVVKRDLKKNLKQGIFFREKNKFEDGEVEEISINGETEFDDNDKYLPSAKVAIVYHTYIGSQNNAEVDKQKYFAKCSSCRASFEYKKSKPVCPYCGEPIGE